MEKGDARQIVLTEAKRRRVSLVSFLLAWAASNMRLYPWRQLDRSPYEVMVAEILLKRTTATSAANAYLVFLEKYPTLAQLATATEDQLAHDLAPLGLQVQRAAALAGLANYLMEYEHGAVPCSLERLLKGSGLGEYSARAILSFACDIPTAVIDTNIERILRRVFLGVMPSPTHKLIRAIADRLLPEGNHRKYNFALLDLGALICRYVHPRCDECPLLSLCDYHGSDICAGGQFTESANKLRTIRKAQRMPLAELARRAGVAKLTIVNIEAGRTHPLYGTVQKLASALDTPVTMFIDMRKSVGEGLNTPQRQRPDRKDNDCRC